MKHFIDKFDDVRVWCLLNDEGMMKGRLLWKWTKSGNCECGIAIWNHKDFGKLDYSETAKANGYGYHKPSASYATLMSKLGIECKGVSAVGDDAVEQHIKETFGLKVMRAI